MRSLLTILFVAAFASYSWGQCTPAYADTTLIPGFNIDGGDTCILKDSWVDFTIQFKNFDEVTVGPVTTTVDSIRIDSINGLPCGLMWNYTPNIIPNSGVGCIRIVGTTSDPVGLYETRVIVSAWVGGMTTPQQQPSTLLNNITLRVNVYDGSTACDAATSLQTASCEMTPWTGINELKTEVSELNSKPNPFSTFTNISFTAEKPATYTFKVYNMLGAEVYNNVVDVTAGNNTIRFERNGLEPGVYVYTLTDGARSISNRMMITE